MHKFASDHPLVKLGLLARSHHGITISLAALRSKAGAGIGEYLDLIPLLLWCERVGFNIIQLLPINDSGLCPSPYSALSSCALHPIYLSLHALAGVESDERLHKELTLFASYKEKEYIPYKEVLVKKLSFLWKYYHQSGKKLLQTKKAQDYIQSQHWLKGYCLYKALQEYFHQQDHKCWPAPYQSYSTAIEKSLPPYVCEAMDFHAMVQYLCYEQLSAVKVQASRHNIMLKGDIPILISRESADIWLNEALFDVRYSAGAPPDAYSSLGQCWDLPLFQWNTMAEDNFSWWKQRLSYASSFYDLYRIDHAIGFFRIWAIPYGKKPSEGFFIPAEEHLLEKQGKKLLSMILHASPMAAIAEDLGVVPDVVRPILKDLGICSTKVMRWEKDYNTGKFLHPSEYPQLSLTCLSTHDTTTLAQWWQECKEDAKALCAERGWPYASTLTTELRAHLLKESHSTKSLFHINLLQEYLGLLPSFVFHDIEKERINIPGTTLDTNWTYRYRPSVEEIITSTELEAQIAKLSLSKK
jgi:4-alpha-glucanotransferase